MGQLYLNNMDFLKAGVPASMIAAFVRLSLSSLSTVRWYTDAGCRLLRLSGMVYVLP
jgi:hypothetical protein